MRKYKQYDVGNMFIIEAKTPYEVLPIEEGEYMVVNDAHFDGEKFYAGEHSLFVKVVKKDSYTIENEVFIFNKKDLERLEADDYLRFFDE